MTLTISLSHDKLRSLNQKAKLLGMTTEEFAASVIGRLAEASNDTFESLLETTEILQDDELMRDIKQGEYDRTHGGTRWAEIKGRLHL